MSGKIQKKKNIKYNTTLERRRALNAASVHFTLRSLIVLFIERKYNVHTRTGFISNVKIFTDELISIRFTDGFSAIKRFFITYTTRTGIKQIIGRSKIDRRFV